MITDRWRSLLFVPTDKPHLIEKAHCTEQTGSFSISVMRWFHQTRRNPDGISGPGEGPRARIPEAHNGAVTAFKTEPRQGRKP
jgi:hypothetical protein